jgi:hypothetical protein
VAAFAEVSDLAAWIGQTIASDDVRALAVLAAASNLIRDEVPDSVHEEWTGEDIPERIAEITVSVAARVWLNPNTLVESFSIDDYTERLREGGAEGLFLTKGEADRLSRYRTGHRGLWTLGTTRGDDYADQYLDTVNAATPATLEEPIPFLPPGA